MAALIQTARSLTGHHILLPSSNKDLHSLPAQFVIDVSPGKSFAAWTLNKGIVFWKIWTAVLFYTLFATVVVTISMKTDMNLGIPNVLITVLGVVIGFVISYRASSGYDRYWAGRSGWSELFRTTRTFSRVIWFNIPLRISPYTAANVDEEMEATMAMKEKDIALDLVEGFVFAMKHHLRGEIGIYYEDLYPLVRTLHDHPHHQRNSNGVVNQGVFPVAESTSTSVNATVSKAHNPHASKKPQAQVPPLTSYGGDPEAPQIHTSIASEARLGHVSSRTGRQRTSGTRSSSPSSEREPLLPSRASADLVSIGFFATIIGWFSFLKPKSESSEPPAVGTTQHHPRKKRSRPMVAGGGYNIPMETLRSLSDWVAVLEARGTVPGTALGTMYGCIQSFEACLSQLEQILTTPLPFIYSVHINTVWIYLFSLPFQLVDAFGWHAIPGVAIASFIYLGFLAAGEEIENPFGYEDNDLDLDLLCRAIMHAEIAQLRHTHAKNVRLPDHKYQGRPPASGIHGIAHADAMKEHDAPHATTSS